MKLNPIAYLLSEMLIYCHMAHNLDQAALYLSQNIQALRTTRGLTQNQLAKLADIPRSTLTYLESGQGNPSLQNLVKVAGALQVSIEELLAAPRARHRLIKAAEISHNKKGSVFFHDLLPDPIPGMHIDRMEFDAGARASGVPHLSGTKEYMTCLQGEVTVKIASGMFRVCKGDVFAFPGDQPHSYHNTGNSKAVCISVVVIAPPGV